MNQLQVRYDLIVYDEQPETLEQASELRSLEARLEKLVKVNQTMVDNINRKIESLISSSDHLSHLRDMRNILRSEIAAIAGSGVSHDNPNPAQETADPSRDHEIKILWRRLAKLLHPDSEGGDAELFDIARKAYEDGDEETLLAMHHQVSIPNRAQRRAKRNRLQPRINLVKIRIQSAEVSQSLIKASDLYRISAMPHQDAHFYMTKVLTLQIQQLYENLSTLRNRNGNYQNQSQE